MKKIIILLLLNLVFQLQAQEVMEVKKGILHLKIEPTNTVYTLGEAIFVKIIFKNVSASTIRFYKKFQRGPSNHFFRLQRIKLPTDKGGEAREGIIGITSVSLTEEPDMWATLKPGEEYSTIVNIEDLVKERELIAGKHKLILLFRHRIDIFENGRFRYLENEKGRVFKRWPSEPFTLTLKAPKSPTAESSK